MTGRRFPDIRPTPVGEPLHRNPAPPFSVPAADYDVSGAEHAANRPAKRRRAIVACSTCRDRKTRVRTSQTRARSLTLGHYLRLIHP